MARFPTRTLFALSGRTDSVADAIAHPQGLPVDYAVAGQFFLSAASDERPLQRLSDPIQKEQQDTEPEPGEQTLTGWWLRSQESFHRGAGVVYQEARGGLDPSERFRESQGIDVWTPGEARLLPDTESLRPGALTSLVAQGMDGTTPVVFQASGNVLYRVTDSGSAPVSWGGTGTIIGLEVCGGVYYAIDAVGVWKGTVAGGVGAKLWTLTAATNAFYKRSGGFALLMVGPKVYDVTDESVSPILPAALLTIGEPDWVWTDATNGPGDVRASGHSAGESAIWRFDPTLSASGWTFAQATGLPRGELVHSIENYYNTMLALGTSKGVRFAAYTETEQYTFGPLTYESAHPVRALAVSGRFVYAGVQAGMPDGSSGLVRIDPEAETTEGRFAWANDLAVGATTAVVGVVTLGTRPVIAVAVGSFVEHPTDLVTTGFLQTGRIRFRTLENKVFKRIRLRTDPLAGSIQVAAVLPNDTTAAVTTFSEQGTDDLPEVRVPTVLGRQESIGLRFTLARSLTDATDGPVIRSYQLKALPAPDRRRVFVLPLSCFDNDSARNGRRLGYVGYGLARLRALEAAEESGDVVMFQDFGTGESRLVTIERIEFRQTTPPEAAPWGGALNLTLRTA